MSEKKTYDKGVKYAKATLAMEGLEVSEKQEKLALQFLNGEITEEKFKEENKKLAANG